MDFKIFIPGFMVGFFAAQIVLGLLWGPVIPLPISVLGLAVGLILSYKWVWKRWRE
jgi:hypothetical protein